MADCYIVRRGGAGGDERDTDIMFSIGYAGLLPPIEDVLNGGETKQPTLKIIDMYLPTEIYQQGKLYDTTPADNISVVDLSTAIIIDNLTVNSAVKIYGGGMHSITYGWTYTVNVPENSDNSYELYIGVSAEGSNYDLAYVDVNGTQIGGYTTSSGTLTTHAIPLNLEYGDNTISVKYKKDSSASRGDDAVYIYGIACGKYRL